MKKQKSTLRALLASTLALIMCMSMLIGTTFAWFTDSVSSVNNIITAGNLDVVLEYTTDGENWNPVETDTELFGTKDLWEPGHKEVVVLRVKNAGSLAFKYDLSTDVYEETSSINVYGDEFKLSDYLVVESLCYGSDAYGADWMVESFLTDRGADYATAEHKLGEALGNTGSTQAIAAGAADHLYFIAITMPTTVGNEANHNGVDIPEIKFSVNLVATQNTVEEDSFGRDYDKDAEYPEIWNGEVGTVPEEVDGTITISTPAELAAFANDVNVNGKNYSGKTVVLANNIDLGNHAWTPIGQTGATQFQGTFDGQGHTISNLYIDSSAQTGEHYSSGLFGWLNNATVKNVNVNGATVKGNHNVAVIAGYLETSGCTVSNCTVTNATVIANHANKEACGDKAGVIVGHAGNAGVKVENCSAKDCTVTAGRDAGQIVGAALEANVVSCTATNVTVTATGDCTGANITNAVIGRLL